MEVYLPPSIRRVPSKYGNKGRDAGGGVGRGELLEGRTSRAPGGSGQGQGLGRAAAASP